MTKDKKSTIIVIEGKDGSGKQTQSKLLYDLMNHSAKAYMQSFPNYESPSSYGVNKLLAGELEDNGNMAGLATLAYTYDRAITMFDKSSPDLLTAIKDYDYVVFDRYTTSSILHQSIRFSTYEEIDKYIDFVQYLEYEVMKLPKPDIVFYLDIPYTQCIKNIEIRGREKDINENEEHLSKVDEISNYVIDKLGWVKIDCYDREKDRMLCPLEIHIKIAYIVHSLNKRNRRRANVK